MTDDPIMTEIFAAIALLQGGDRLGGRKALETIWARIADAPAPLHACTLAHYMADAQDDLADELAWDIRALEAALRCTDAEAQRQGQGLPIAAFMPSLHINLADDYFRLGDVVRSRNHLEAAQSFAGHLANDSYGRMIHGGIARLASKLANGAQS